MSESKHAIKIIVEVIGLVLLLINGIRLFQSNDPPPKKPKPVRPTYQEVIDKVPKKYKGLDFIQDPVHYAFDINTKKGDIKLNETNINANFQALEDLFKISGNPDRERQVKTALYSYIFDHAGFYLHIDVTNQFEMIKFCYNDYHTLDISPFECFDDTIKIDGIKLSKTTTKEELLKSFKLVKQSEVLYAINGKKLNLEFLFDNRTHQMSSIMIQKAELEPVQ